MTDTQVLPVSDPSWADRYDHFLIELRGQVALISINRPHRLNSMALSFWTQLPALLVELAADPSVRAAIITGVGTRAFSAGGDIDDFAKLADESARREYMRNCMSAFAAVEDSPLTIIAAVNGWALGGGCELTLACDMALATDTAVFGMPEAAIGLVPGFGVLRGPSVLGLQWTKLMVLAGERIDASQAYALGVVQRVVPADELIDAAMALAERVAAQAPLAVAVGKQLINRGLDHSEAQVSIDAVVALQNSYDFAEGRTAFREGRSPEFHAR